MTRPIVASLGLGLAVLWVVARTEDATSWMVWLEGATTLGVFGVVGLVPARSSAPLAGTCLFALALVLLALWLLALLENGTPWFAWWLFTFACLCAAATVTVVFQGQIDEIRTPNEL